MKDFTRRGNWLDRASVDIRAIYTGFLLFALIGHLSFVAIAVTHIGPGVDAVVAHYLGGEDEEEVFFPRDFTEILETTHFHATIQGITLLVLTHIFVALPIGPKLKRGTILLAFLSTFIDLLAPWLIRYVSPSAAYVQIAGWLGMSISYFPLTLMPAYYMWKGKTEKD